MSDDETVDSSKEDLSKEYEEKYSYKYGDDDSYFAEAVEKKIEPPPCINPWYNKPKRNFDYSRDSRRDDRRDRKYDDNRSDRRHNYRYQPYHRNYNRRDDRYSRK